MNDLQRTDEWFLARKGRMTSSECFYLLKNGTRPMTDEELAKYKAENPKGRSKTIECPFDAPSYNYMNRKIAEYYMPNDSYIQYISDTQVGNAATQWGTELEDTAREAYSEATGIKVEDAPFVPLKGYENFFGGSPDGLCTDKDGSHGIVEFKCPYNPAVHIEHLLYRTPSDIMHHKDGGSEGMYYWQMMGNMLVTRDEWKTEWCDFVSYGPRTSKDKQLKVLRIPYSKLFSEQLLSRIKLAVSYYQRRMAKIDNAQSIINEYELEPNKA